MRVRFDLHVRYTVEVDLCHAPSTLEEVQREANKAFDWLLRQYVQNLDVYGCSAPPGGSASQPAVPLRDDAGLKQYLEKRSELAIYEVHLPEESMAQVAELYRTTLKRNQLQIRRLTDQVTQLRQQGQGLQQGFHLMQKAATANDAQIVGVVQEFGHGIDPCVTAMAGSATDLWTNQQGLRMLMLYAQDSHERLQEIQHTGGFQLVVIAMQNFPQDEAVQQYAHHFVATAASDHEYCAELHKLGVVELLIRNLRAWEQDARIQLYGCWSLGELAATPELLDAVAKAGAIAPLMAAMRNFPRDAMVRRYALSALQPLAYGRAHALEITNSVGLASTVEVLKGQGSDPEVTYYAIAVLAEVARHDECKELLATAGVVEALLIAMEANPEGKAIRERGLRCLAFLAAGSPQNQARVFRANGVPAVIAVINAAVAAGGSCETTLGLVAAGLDLLANLAAHAECRPTILKFQGIACVMQALAAHPREAPVQEHGLRVVAGLASSPDAAPPLLEAGVLDAIFGAMRALPQDLTVQISGCYAAGTLAVADSARALVVERGGVEVLLAAVYGHPREPRLHEQACAALAILCELDRARALIAAWSYGDPPRTSAQVLLASCRAVAAVPSAAKQGLKLVAAAALDEGFCKLLLEAEALNVVAAALREHPSDAGVVLYGLRAVVALCHPRLPDSVPQQLVLDFLDFVIMAMRTFHDSVRIQECGCEVLALLGRSEPLQGAIVGKGGVSAVCTALRAFQADESVQHEGCRAVAHLAEFEVSRVALRKEGVAAAVIAALQRHSGHAEVTQQACAAAANLALDAESRAMIAEHKGVDAILVALRQGERQPGVLAYGLGALGNLAVEEEHCRVIVQAGAIKMVIHAMTTWPDDARLQHFACLACSNFAHEEASKAAIGKVGGNNMIVKAMQRHSAHAGVQEQGCGALANLGVDPQNMAEIAQLSGIELVVLAARQHASHRGVQENACFALSKFLATPNEGYRQRMRAAGAEEALSLIGASNPSFDVRICVNVLLRRLSTEPKEGLQGSQYGAQAAQGGGSGGYGAQSAAQTTSNGSGSYGAQYGAQTAQNGGGGGGAQYAEPTTGDANGAGHGANGGYGGAKNADAGANGVYGSAKNGPQPSGSPGGYHKAHAQTLEGPKYGEKATQGSGGGY